MQTLWILEDHPLFSLALKQILNSHKINTKIIDLKTIDEFSGYVKNHPSVYPDLFIMDLRVNGCENSLVWLRDNYPSFSNVPIFILTQSHSPFTHSLSKSLGAKGYLSKDAHPEKIILGIKTCLRGETFFDDVTEESANPTKITRREKEILLHLSLGMSARESGALLQISHRTAEVHRKNLCAKLNAKNAVDLVRIAIQTGLIPQADESATKE
jgi:DNA-binding NarL/FixJ family response regulator